MIFDPVKNFAKVTVDGYYDADDVDITLVTGEISKLPDTDGDAFNLVWWNYTDYKDPSDDPNKELVRLDPGFTSGDTFRIIRAQEGTSASTKNEATKTYKMALVLTKKMMDDIFSPLTPIEYSGGNLILNPSNGNFIFPYGGVKEFLFENAPALSGNEGTSMELTLGTGEGIGGGGYFTLATGDSGDDGGFGGNILLSAGEGIDGGGNVEITAGNARQVVDPEKNGGAALYLYRGEPTKGGNVLIESGSGYIIDNEVAGDITIQCGVGTSGGNITIKTREDADLIIDSRSLKFPFYSGGGYSFIFGNAPALSDTDGASAEWYGGNGDGQGSGGEWTITAGNSGNDGGAGGNIGLNCGNGIGGGGTMSIKAGNATHPTDPANGGSIEFRVGTGINGGDAGKFKFYNDAGFISELDFSAVTADRAFSFPDKTGSVPIIEADYLRLETDVLFPYDVVPGGYQIIFGDAPALSGDEGTTIQFGTGKGDGSGIGGAFIVNVGASGDDGGVGGNINLNCGDGIDAGGSFYVYAGSGGHLTDPADGGSINLTLGEGVNGGLNGKLNIWIANSFKAIFDFDDIATADKTFTFPNASGTLALVSDLITDHGALSGLTDDDHTQYHTDARAKTWLENEYTNKAYFPSGIVFGSTTQEYDISGTTWVASTDGTPNATNHLLADVLAVTSTPNLATYLAVREITGTSNQQTVEFTFSNVVDWRYFEMRYQYSGGTAHKMFVEFWNTQTSSWERRAELSFSTLVSVHSFKVIDNTHFNNAGTVKCRLVHSLDNGNATHYSVYAYVALSRI